VFSILLVNELDLTQLFQRRIYFPKEARIDALAFVNKVVAVGQQLSKGRLTVIEHCPAVISVDDVNAPATGVCITLRDGTRITANHAVVATNGMFLNSHLAGILRPCWSYFLTLPHPRDPLRGSQRISELSKPALLGGHSSRNFFTFGFTHDWCVTDGAYRISGADHFSALKPPRSQPRCQALADWTFSHYPHMKSMVPGLPDTSRVDPASTKWLQGRYIYGVYGETPDYMPLLGKADAGSRIVYALGCNAWGQASLTFAASVVPGLLGFAVLTKEQAECADAMALSRFKTLPAYMNKLAQSKL
jgi:glycine/D-amino acid oxidase-like deaminating enzyme